MKRIFMMLSIFVLVTEVHAIPMRVSSGEKTFESHDGILQLDVDLAEKPLRAHMEDAMGCSRVRLDLGILKQPGFFSDGQFVLELSVDCDSAISDLRIDFDPLCSEINEGDAALVLEYSNSGRPVTQRFIVRNSGSCRE